jgi:hypothetical protein
MNVTINPAWVAHNALYNEGGEGYNPHRKWIAKLSVKPSLAVRMLKDERGNLIPADKLAARLARDIERRARITDPSAIEIIDASIAYAREALA